MKKYNIILSLITIILFRIMYCFTPLSSRIKKASIEFIKSNNVTNTRIQNNEPLITSWVTITINTWATMTWETNIPQEPRDFLWYIYNNWIEWIDYMAVEPPKQPVIRSTDKEENNKVIKNYFNKNRILFNIPKTDKIPYILIITNKEIPNNRDFFLWLDWTNMWPIKKEKSLIVNNTNEYLYPLYWIIKAWLSPKTFDVKWHIENNKLDLNVFVWEAWNYVEKIIIFFK